MRVHPYREQFIPIEHPCDPDVDYILRFKALSKDIRAQGTLKQFVEQADENLLINYFLIDVVEIAEGFQKDYEWLDLNELVDEGIIGLTDYIKSGSLNHKSIHRGTKTAIEDAIKNYYLQEQAYRITNEHTSIPDLDFKGERDLRRRDAEELVGVLFRCSMAPISTDARRLRRRFRLGEADTGGNLMPFAEVAKLEEVSDSAIQQSVNAAIRIIKEKCSVIPKLQRLMLELFNVSTLEELTSLLGLIALKDNEPTITEYLSEKSKRIQSILTRELEMTPKEFMERFELSQSEFADFLALILPGEDVNMTLVKELT